ncbi:histidine phosphatase family protein [Lyngbya sp. PCC 8106]|uniref:histidine phosphatase family protein n=1 Tax=Lyngbya sp. (strain PCC 8106) TaxID=313612 RepID=UPI0000EAD981|nr:histidine phosphatase family protein [Lyngbya sp. PCC 8106]EAW34926.1 Phosphoglycerate/bisphosphoglycerate mutase [Lyngbya sp. PCC 8106]
MRLPVNVPRRLSHETTVILVRHGESLSDLPGYDSGNCDEDVLTEKGRDHASLTGLALKKSNISAIYTSPLKPTQQTAIEILGAFSQTGETLPQMRQSEDLEEIDLSACPDLPLQKVRKEFSSEFQMEVSSSTKAAKSPKKSAVCSLVKASHSQVLDLYQHSKKFWKTVLRRHQGQTILVIGHSNKNRALINTALGIEASLFHSSQQSSCGISILKFPQNRLNPGELKAINMTAHLCESLPQIEVEKQGLRLLFVSASNQNPQQIKKISEQLQAVSIDFCLSQILNNSQIISDQILRYHPNVMQFQVLKDDLLQAWEKKIQERNQFASAFKQDKKIRTGLVIVDDLIIKHFLSQVLNLSLNQVQNWQLDPGTIHSIYYPFEHPATIQTLNYRCYL